jgi:chemotaxis protein methyltransferase CheR
MTDEPELDKKTFEKFADLVYEKAGIKLGPNKEALVSARVRKRMRALSIPNYEGYLQFVHNDEDGGELVELLNAISTNVTHFFREAQHFELLGKLLRQWSDAGQTRFRIWCAASSTGEEPYSIAITVKESLKDCRDVRILATDISTKVLGLAKAGVYDEKHVDKVPESLFRKYFTKVTGNLKLETGAEKNSQFQVSSIKYQVSAELRRLLTFSRLNLAKPPFPMQGPFDVVFCRNVMIYFDNEVRRRLLADCYRLLKDGGYLMVGHAESLSGMLSEFKSVMPSVYVKG